MAIIHIIISLIFLILNIIQCNTQCPDPYEKCTKPIDGMLNIHIVPHTHDDVGWLKTVDQYYYGSNIKEQHATVQMILDNVVRELQEDPSRRFVYVEMAFFWMWYIRQNNNTQEMVKNLVAERRLEFVIGGWCMNDEAATYYNDMIDQQTLGFKFILREFGECARPRVAWQLDPFGHSREQASLFAQFGFDGLFLGRIDYQDNDYKRATKTREFIWQGSQNLGDSGKIFTGVLPNVYGPPGGFCFDQYCDDDPIMDDPTLDEYNLDKKINDFIIEMNQTRVQYKTNNLIATMGSDFQYSNARMWFKNLDKLIYQMNLRRNETKINLFYSTPSCYLHALNQANETWTEKTDDFFPYAHQPHSFWTGYFTSRPSLKSYVRRSNNFLQSVRQLSAFAKLSADVAKSGLDNLSEAMGVLQHHDAVSGTSRQHVAKDYAKRLARGTENSLHIINEAYKSLSPEPSLMLNNYYCPLLNISQCLPIEELNSFVISLYNPLARDVWYNLRIPVVGNSYKVRDLQSGSVLVSDIVEIPAETKKIPERSAKSDHEIHLSVKLPALSFTFYNVTKVQSTENELLHGKRVKLSGDFVIKNQHIELDFDANGALQAVKTLDSSAVATNLKQTFCYYDSYIGIGLVPEFQSSGTYIFRPKKQEPVCEKVTNFKVYQGENVQVVHQIYTNWISQTIRLYNDSRHVEFEWQVGPIPAELLQGKEVITKFESDLSSNATYYTDSNGREILKRVRNFRPGWPHFNQTEPVAGNYYPINSRIFIRDELASSSVRQLTILTDRSQGGASIHDGSIEIMVNRRIFSDDQLGVTEPMDELGADGRGIIARGVHYLLFNTSENSARIHRDLAHRINMQPLITFSNEANADEQGLLKNFEALASFKAISTSLPDNVELLTFMQDFDANNTIIMRFEHFYEVNEDDVLSKPVTIDLVALFEKSLNIVSIKELSLGANMDVKELANKMKWGNQITNSNLPMIKEFKMGTPYEVQLTPMQIRTFQIVYN